MWKFPQGGVEEDEKEESAVLRELKGELGTDKFQIFTKSSFFHRVDWDEESIRLAGYKWKGQRQVFFLVKFLGGGGDIQINTNEIRACKWVRLNDLRKYIYHNRKPFIGYADAIEKAISEFSKFSSFSKKAEAGK